MTTQLEYLDDSEKYQSEAVVARIEQFDGVPSVILDRTIFYPQGGGQPTDRGVIRAGDSLALVDKVIFQNGDVYHNGRIEGGLAEGDHVYLEIDADRRKLHAKLHTGGHLVMTAVDQILKLPAAKGYHFPDGPYVEFIGATSLEVREGLVARLQQRIDEMVEENSTVTAQYESVDNLRAKGVYMPAEIPSGKPTRVVITCGYYSPCGGTHVKSLGELSGLTVRGVKSKSGNTRVSYLIQ